MELVCLAYYTGEKYLMYNRADGKLKKMTKGEVIELFKKKDKVRNIAIDTIVIGNGHSNTKTKEIRFIEGYVSAYFSTPETEDKWKRKLFILDVIVKDDVEVGYLVVDRTGRCFPVSKAGMLNYLRYHGINLVLNGKVDFEHETTITKANRSDCVFYAKQIESFELTARSLNEEYGYGTKGFLVTLILDKITAVGTETGAGSVELPSCIQMINKKALNSFTVYKVHANTEIVSSHENETDNIEFIKCLA